MLFNPHPLLLQPDFILAAVAAVNGSNPNTVKLADGVYQIGHFGGTSFLRRYEHYPELRLADGEWFGPHGVCDNYQQVLDKCPMLTEDESRRFVLTVKEVRRENQPPEGGWRWHKWGYYIGTKTPTREYLYDEPEIEAVFVYHIYEAK